MNRTHILILKVTFVFLLIFGVNLQWAHAGSPLEPAELLKQYQLGEIVVSPDGKRVAVVTTEPAKGAEERSSIWLYERTSDVFRQLTTIGKTIRSPRWAPDGQTLGFISEREDKKPQIFLLPMSGGEGLRLSSTDAAIGSFKWSPDGSTIAYLAKEKADDPKEQDKAGKADERVVSEDFKPNQLWTIGVNSREVREVLAKDDWTISEFAWLPNNQQLVVAANNSRKPELLTDELYVIDRTGGKMRSLGKPDGPLQGLQVSPDGKTLAYIGVSDGGPIPHDVYLQSIAGGTPRNLTSTSIDRLVTKFVWLKRDSLLILTGEGFGSTLYRLNTAGKITRQQNFPDQLLWDVAINGDLLASIRSSATSPPELWISNDKKGRPVSSLHANFPQLVSAEIYRYASNDGLEIEAALFLPNERPNAPLPLITLVHGGPTGRWSNRINDWAQLLVSRGYAVFAPNIRGSVGYGLSFVRSNRRDWGGGDFRDVMAGIDKLIDRGIADPDRLGIGGWSYGGYMSAWAVTQTRRFKAAVIGAPMTDLAVEYGTEKADINAYDTWFLGTPYENLDDFIRMSPLTYVKNARTPALILVGEKDPIDPVAQNWQFYRGLRRYDVEAELVIYPRELHRIKEELHKLDVFERMTLWFDRFIK
ncbi:MAG: alpha/beta fold hydrolase [Acidiferrobacterales bacterium]